MIKGKDILGQPIVAISTGQRVDDVTDIILDHQGNRVLGLLVDEGGWFRAAKVVPFENIKSFGEHAVMIATPEAVTTTRKDDRLAEVLDGKVNLIGMALLTTDGQRLGRISDVYFDERTGLVEGYESTGGFFADLSGGRTFVPAPAEVSIGPDAAIVPISVAHAMQERHDQAPGGIRGVFHNAAESVREGVKGTVENIATASEERQQQYVVGRQAGSELVAKDGTVIVRKGETITPLHAEVAQWNGLLTALAVNATGAAVSGAVAGAYQSAADTIREGTQQAQSNVKSNLDEQKSAASGLLGRVRERVQDTFEDVKDAAEERQKAFVVGKIATRDIGTDSGEVIVRKGETISVAQAERAEQTGTLTALLTAAELLGGSTQAAPTQTGPADAELVGLRVRSEVRSATGSLVAAQGQIVTPAILERARHLEVENALVQATRSDRLVDDAAQAVAGAGAAVAGGLSSVTEGAAGLLDRAKGWFEEKRDGAEAALREREQADLEARIQDALGRPVHRVVLTPDDRVILNLGEVVTNKAVQEAREAGVLEMLLGSVR